MHGPRGCLLSFALLFQSFPSFSNLFPPFNTVMVCHVLESKIPRAKALFLRKSSHAAMPTYYPNRRARKSTSDTGDNSSTRRAAAVPDPVVSDPVLPDLVVSAAAPVPVPDPVVSSSSDVALPAASTTRHDAGRDDKRKRPESAEAGADVDVDVDEREGSRKRAAAAGAANPHAQQQHLESSPPKKKKKKKKRRGASGSSGKVGHYKKGKNKAAYTYVRKTAGTSGAGTAADDDEDGPEVVFVPPTDAAGTSGAGTAAAPTLAVAPVNAAPPVPAPAVAARPCSSAPSASAEPAPATGQHG